MGLGDYKVALALGGGLGLEVTLNSGPAASLPCLDHGLPSCLQTCNHSRPTMHHFALSPQGPQSPDLRESLLPCLHQESLCSWLRTKRPTPPCLCSHPLPCPSPRMYPFPETPISSGTPRGLPGFLGEASSSAGGGPEAIWSLLFQHRQFCPPTPHPGRLPTGSSAALALPGATSGGSSQLPLPLTPGHALLTKTRPKQSGPISPEEPQAGSGMETAPGRQET